MYGFIPICKAHSALTTEAGDVIAVTGLLPESSYRRSWNELQSINMGVSCGEVSKFQDMAIPSVPPANLQ